MTASPADGTLRENLELKARAPEPAKVAAALRRLQAEDAGWLIQRDTYFNAPKGAVVPPFFSSGDGRPAARGRGPLPRW